MKVLIVDDSPQSLAVAQARLAKDGLEVLLADNGQAGLDLVRREKPDLVLLDIDMPEPGGFEVCKAIKQDPNLSMIPIIFLTGTDDVESKIQGLDLGAVDYVTKPFNVFELRARVRTALRTKRLQDLLLAYSHIDPLTELWNRRAILARLDQEWARYERYRSPVALVLADLDRFRAINEGFGHNVGDQLLQAVARALAEQCRKTDLAARFGGEEFLIIVPEQQVQTARELAERCRRKIEEVRLNIDGTTVQTTASFGVADNTDVKSAKDMLDRADDALYRAKSKGGNRTEIQSSEAVVDADDAAAILPKGSR
jgi:two-component system, cell cycle response regulator